MSNTKDSDYESLKKKKFKLTLLYCGVLLLFLTLVTALIHTALQQEIDKDRAIKQQLELFNMGAKITSELSAVATDLIHYSHSTLAKANLSSHDPIAEHYLTSLMSSISSLQKNYDQIRLFDRLGKELIRIDQSPDLSLQLIPRNKLQNKSNRYYLKNAMLLQPGQIYISKFDLNKEREEVEYPIKPTLRFVTPIHSKDGKLLGAGAINYIGAKLLQILADLNTHKGEHFFLINSNGYYLAGDEAKSWSFMFPKKEQFLFSDDYPNVWQQMVESDNGKVITDDGEYYFSSFSLSPYSSFDVVNEEHVFLIMHVPDFIIDNEHSQFTKVSMISFILTALLFTFLSWALACYQVEQKRLLNKLKFEAGHDALTGLSNRREIFNYLNKNISASLRRNTSLSLAYIDVNDLKKTNDRCGHDSGDQLIKGVATVINQTIRKSDYAARLGGDEFLIILADCDKDNATVILERIQTRYAELGKIKAKRKWSLSYGCTELLNETDTAKKMIDRADKAMYKQKVSQKQLSKHA